MIVASRPDRQVRMAAPVTSWPFAPWPCSSGANRRRGCARARGTGTWSTNGASPDAADETGPRIRRGGGLVCVREKVVSPLREDLHEQVDSSASPLAVHRLHGDGHRQLRGHGATTASRLGDLLTAVAAGLAPVYRPVPLRAAVRRQMARRKEGSRLT